MVSCCVRWPLALSGRKFFCNISRVDELVGGASKRSREVSDVGSTWGHRIKPPTGDTYHSDADTLASKGVVKSQTKWYLDRRGHGFAQSLTIAVRRRISWTNKLRRRNKGLVPSETKHISFIFEKKTNGKLIFSIVIKYVYRVFVSLLYPGRSSPVWPCPKRDLKLIIVTYRLSLNNSMAMAVEGSDTTWFCVRDFEIT